MEDIFRLIPGRAHLLQKLEGLERQHHSTHSVLEELCVLQEQLEKVEAERVRLQVAIQNLLETPQLETENFGAEKPLSPKSRDSEPEFVSAQEDYMSQGDCDSLRTPLSQGNLHAWWALQGQVEDRILKAPFDALMNDNEDQEKTIRESQASAAASSLAKEDGCVGPVGPNDSVEGLEEVEDMGELRQRLQGLEKELAQALMELNELRSQVPGRLMVTSENREVEQCRGDKVPAENIDWNGEDGRDGVEEREETEEELKPEAKLDENDEESEVQLDKPKEQQNVQLEEKEELESDMNKKKEELHVKLDRKERESESELSSNEESKVQPEKKEEESEVYLNKKEEESEVYPNKKEEESEVYPNKKEEESEVYPNKKEEESEVYPTKKEEESEVYLTKKEEESEVYLNKKEEESKMHLGNKEEEPEVQLGKKEEEPEVKLDKKKEASKAQLDMKGEELEIKKQEEAKVQLAKKEEQLNVELIKREEVQLEKKEDPEMKLNKKEEEAKVDLDKKEEESKVHLGKKEEESEMKLDKKEEESVHLNKKEEEPQVKLDKKEEESEMKLDKKEEESVHLNKKEEEPEVKLDKKEEEPEVKLDKKEEESKVDVDKKEESVHLKKKEEEPEVKLEKKEEESEMKLDKKEEEAKVHLGKKEEESEMKLDKKEEESKVHLGKNEEESEMRLDKKEEKSVHLNKKEEEPEVKLDKKEEEPEVKLDKKKEESKVDVDQKEEESEVQLGKKEEESVHLNKKEEEPEVKLDKKEEELEMKLDRKEEDSVNLNKKEEESEMKLDKKEEESEMKLDKKEGERDQVEHETEVQLGKKEEETEAILVKKGVDREALMKRGGETEGDAVTGSQQEVEQQGVVQVELDTLRLTFSLQLEQVARERAEAAKQLSEALLELKRLQCLPAGDKEDCCTQTSLGWADITVKEELIMQQEVNNCLCRQQDVLHTTQHQETLSKFTDELAKVACELQAERALRNDADQEISRLQAELQAIQQDMISKEEHDKVKLALQRSLEENESSVLEVQQSQKNGQQGAATWEEREVLCNMLRGQISSLTTRLNNLSRKHQNTCSQVLRVQREALFSKATRQAAEAQLSIARQHLAYLRTQSDHLGAAKEGGGLPDLSPEILYGNLPLTLVLPSSPCSDQQVAPKSRVATLKRQLQDWEEKHRAVVSVYRAHLLAAVQGRMDEEVQGLLLQILRMTQTEPGH